jgi:hypothetical protein
MTTLLEAAIAGHGGWERWQRTKQLRVHASVGGAIWPVKGWEGVHADLRCVVDADRQRVDFAPFVRPNHHGIYEPDRTRLTDDKGRILEEQKDPRATFAGHTIPTPWSTLQMLYFSGYAMWTYMTGPFSFNRPGFKTQEIEPWDENGEIWRRLKVTFPPDVASHSTDQIFYFDTTGLLRRHDYSVEIMGGTSSAHYANDHKSFGGLVFPTKRRVYSIGEGNRPILDRIAVAIDILEVTVE